MSQTSLKCLFCDAEALWEFSEFSVLPRVTSDCRPFRSGGRLLVCKNCSVVQKVPDEIWLADIARIYASYDMYRQGGGAEQSVLDPASNRFVLRSDLIVRHLESRLGLRKGARVLDVGCGTGVTLEAFARTAIGLRLFGLEHDTRNLPRLSRITGFEELFLGSIRDVPIDFELVTLVHALEHFPNPAVALASSAERLGDDGALFVQVVNSPENPFDLVIADHMAHFSAASLRDFAVRQNLHVVSLDTNVIRRELAMIATRHSTMSARSKAASAGDGATFAARNLDWLSAVLDEAKLAATRYASFGLFGSSIAATWLADALGDRVRFFVDEDPARVGRRHLDLPIVAPSDVPAQAAVFVGMAPVSAESVLSRFSKSAIRLIPPPKMGSGRPSSTL